MAGMVEKQGKDRGSRIPLTSTDITAERLEALQQLLPEVFSEGRIDFDKLRLVLGEQIDEGRERYGLTWAGKAEAVRAIQVPSTGTLAPVRGESVDFDTTGNLMIEGENLEVLKLLQKAYHGKVKMIYIDPPYNTGKEFIYPDNFREGLRDYLRYSGQVDDEGFRLTSNTETSGRYHSKWLSMMYPRLFLARNLLREDGVIFVSIDDHEVHNLMLLMNEIYGVENFIGTIVWKGATDNNPTQIATEHEYIICFAMNKAGLASEWKNSTVDAKTIMLTEYKRLAEKYGNDVDAIQVAFRRFIKANKEALTPLTHYNRIDTRGPYTGSRKVHNPKPGGYEYDVVHPETREVCARPANGYRYPEARMQELIHAGRIIFGEDHTQILQIKEYLTDYEGKLSSVIHLDSRAGANELAALFDGERKIFTNPKPVALLRELFDFCLKDGDTMLDFFAGSGSSGQAVLELNARDGGHRGFVLVQLPERLDPEKAEHKAAIAYCDRVGEPRVLTTIIRARLRKAAESIAGQWTGKLNLDGAHDIDLGFRVFKLTASNFKLWEAAADDSEELARQLELYADNVAPGAQPEAVLYELMLKAGIPLTAGVERLDLGGQEVFSIDDGGLFICLADPITRECIRAMIAKKPRMVLCLDHAFRGNDQLLTNTVLEMKSHGVEHFRTV